MSWLGERWKAWKQAVTAGDDSVMGWGLLDWAAEKLPGHGERWRSPWKGTLREDRDDNFSPERFIVPAKKLEGLSYYSWPNANGRQDDFEIDGVHDNRVVALAKRGEDLSALHYLPPDRLNPVWKEALAGNALTAEIFTQFGAYNTTGKNNPDASRRFFGKYSIADIDDSKDWDLTVPAPLVSMPQNSLECRHQAPLLSSALRHGGIDNYYLGGTITIDGHKEALAHGYVISKHVPLIFEATIVAHPSLAARYTLNGVTLKDMKKGARAVTVDQNGYMVVYGLGYPYDTSEEEFKVLAAEDQKLMEHYRPAAEIKAAEMSQALGLLNMQDLLREGRTIKDTQTAGKELQHTAQTRHNTPPHLMPPEIHSAQETLMADSAAKPTLIPSPSHALSTRQTRERQ